MKVACAVFGVTLALAAPALAARQVITPSGQPDALFEANLADTMSKLTNACMNKGWAVTSQSPNQLVCEPKVGVFQSALQQLLLGNSYSTTPRSFVRFFGRPAQGKCFPCSGVGLGGDDDGLWSGPVFDLHR